MKRLILGAAITAASLAAFAQPYGPGPGGPGPGPGARGMPRFNDTTTPGWSLMSAEERGAHQERMRSMKGYDECEAYMVEHRKLMDERAKEKGKALRGRGPGPACDVLKGK